MAPLPIEDQRHLNAAEGWLELGDHLEADEELENLRPKRSEAALRLKREVPLTRDCSLGTPQFIQHHPRYSPGGTDWMRRPSSLSPAGVRMRRQNSHGPVS